jgi:Raf kinase inhibitor-like YbhB/YbcL family protein
LFFIISIIILDILIVGVVKRGKKSVSIPNNGPSHTIAMNITSPAFEREGKIPSKFTCDGDGINPALQFDTIPEKVKSLALIMDDPDAPSGTWDHWVLYNIPSETRGVGEGETVGISGQNSWRKTGYGGPCPPDREHRYFFKLYALDSMLDLPAGSTKDKLLAAMEGHILAEAELMGRYNRRT